MTLQSQVREHYSSQSLRPEKLAELTAIAAPRWERWIVPTVVAAIVLVAVGLAATMQDTTESVGQEIAVNHLRALDPEFAVTRFDEISRHMERLDFEPRLPERIAERNLTVQGARYCSVQGRIAAQVRLTDSDGARYTLYMVRAIPRVRAGTTTHDGVEVELWNEGDLSIGLARGQK